MLGTTLTILTPKSKSPVMVVSTPPSTGLLVGRMLVACQAWLSILKIPAEIAIASRTMVTRKNFFLLTVDNLKAPPPVDEFLQNLFVICLDVILFLLV
jgi:hypothetical protein